jgi:hypothetical protein
MTNCLPVIAEKLNARCRININVLNLNGCLLVCVWDSLLILVSEGSLPCSQQPITGICHIPFAILNRMDMGAI